MLSPGLGVQRENKCKLTHDFHGDGLEHGLAAFFEHDRVYRGAAELSSVVVLRRREREVAVRLRCAVLL